MGGRAALAAMVLAMLAAAATAAADDPRYPDPAGYCDPASTHHDPRDTARDAPPVALPPGFTRRFERLVGVRTPVIEAGPRDSAEAIVFMHGNPGSSLDYAGLMAAVPRGARAVAFDFPGFGKAEKPYDFPYSLAGVPGQMSSVLRDLGIRRVHLVAHDIGGVVGLEWGAAHPRQLASVTALNSGALIGYTDHEFARSWRTPVQGEASMAAVTREGFVSTIQGREPRPLPREFLDRNYDDFDRGTRCAILRIYRLGDDVSQIGERQAARLRPHDVPALVLWGMRDSFLHPSVADRQRDAFPRAEIHRFADSGHWPFVTEEARSIALARDFFTRTISQRAGRPIRLSVRPRRLRARRTTRLRVQAVVGPAAQPLAGALVTLGKRRARTDSDGRATLQVRPRRTGRLSVRAAKDELAPGRAVVRVLRPARRAR